MKSRLMTEEEKQYIRNNISHLSALKIAKELNRHSNTIYNFCKRENLNHHYARNSFDEDFFKEINSQKKAYILGLLYADGFIIGEKGLGIALHEKDIDVMEYIKKSLQATHEIKLYSNNHSQFNSTGKMARLSFFSKKIVADLEKQGCIKNKTNLLVFPNESQVPEHLQNHFVRGYLDGDGSIYFSNNHCHVTFTGTNGMLNGIQNFFNTSLKLQKKGNSYSLHYTGNKQAARLLDIIYKDAEFFMNRKYEKYTQLVNRLKGGECIGK